MNQNPLKRIKEDLDRRRLIDPNKINSLLKMQEMLFIYNAIMDGWTVKSLDNGRFEFQKERHKVTSDVCLDGYLRDFVNYYLTLQALNSC